MLTVNYQTPLYEMVKVQIDHKDLLIYNTFNFGFIHFYKKKKKLS